MGSTLTSWKEVAAYLGKGVRTVQRWESLHGLPIRRPHDGQTHSVIALREELDEWLHKQRLVHEDQGRIDPSPSLSDENKRLRAEIVKLQSENRQLRTELETCWCTRINPDYAARANDLAQSTLQLVRRTSASVSRFAQELHKSKTIRAEFATLKACRPERSRWPSGARPS